MRDTLGILYNAILLVVLGIAIYAVVLPYFH
jgi:hypothetical protein